MVEASVESAELKEHVIERPRRDEKQDSSKCDIAESGVMSYESMKDPPLRAR